jgi:hypothetical protein
MIQYRYLELVWGAFDGVIKFSGRLEVPIIFLTNKPWAQSVILKGYDICR